MLDFAAAWFGKWIDLVMFSKHSHWPLLINRCHVNLSLALVREPEVSKPGLVWAS
jgi:hypothetical protein